MERTTAKFLALEMHMPGLTFVCSPSSVTRRKECGISQKFKSSERRTVWLRNTPRACVSQPEAKSQTDGSGEGSGTKPKLSKTEQIAAKLGKSKESLEEARDNVMQQSKADKRKRYASAITATLVGVAAFLVQKLDPNSGVNLLRLMFESSAPASVVGTNNKPSMIEFSATWCENCRYTARSVFELEKKYGNEINFLVFNGEDPKNAEVVDRFSVDGIPQFSMISRDGTVKGNLVGRIPRNVLAEDLEALLKDEELPFPGLPFDEIRAAAKAE
ncbi:hypothetical protein BWQ96_10470 [Gracilariopsis chorda]|uniref:Thioredoxin domain-containing protein n=1 Tax=Gracilariopsis chorda TaxID=448386 RepID=A0A2V3ICL6_9FLOR|nr:hypothetical protein BWQ96_10470 [Gracilariopsis chorda]|eukprot:PXF39829.1 hypothetical protein BWQ96_10470 [Gracilariopsis chorda]